LQEFELVLHAQNWHEDRVWFHDANGRLRALPASWTSVVGEDPFNVVAAGRALFGCVAIMAARQENSAMTRSPYATNE
jgi:hypothetical protein